MRAELFQPVAPARDLDVTEVHNLTAVIRNADVDLATRKNAARSLLNHFRQGTRFESTAVTESILIELLLR